MFKKISICFAILCFLVLNICIFSKTNATQQNLKEYFRFHVIANSNTNIDQNAKLDVANNVLNYISQLTKSTTSKEELKFIIQNNIDQVLNVANRTLEANAQNYKAYAKVGNIYYSPRENNEITMNAGVYDSIQIVLGKGQGKNFWSLLYPMSYTNACVFQEEDEKQSNRIVSYEDIISQEIEYSSFIYELIKKILRVFP